VGPRAVLEAVVKRKIPSPAVILWPLLKGTDSSAAVGKVQCTKEVIPGLGGVQISILEMQPSVSCTFSRVQGK
jgi:hypothetical protein